MGVVGSPQDDQQMDASFHLMAETHMPSEPAAEAAATWRRAFEAEHPMPGSGPRAAFRDDTCVGSYLLEVRDMCIGSATVRSGWVGAVVTKQQERQSGIGRALMEDAIAVAKEYRLAVLLLHGIPLFYDRFGYVDVFDPEIHRISRARIATLDPSPYQVRSATPEDAGAVAAIRRRHYAGFAGACDRTAEQEAQRIRFADPAPLLAIDSEGTVKGYLWFSWGVLRWFGCEALADDWPAASALLQHHSSLRGPLQDSSDELTWRLSRDSLTFSHIADHLQTNSSIERMPSAGWMACPVDLNALMDGVLAGAGVLPADSPESVQLLVGDWSGSFTVAGGRLEAAGPGVEPQTRIVLSPEVLVQLLFGYRQLDWARSRPGVEIPHGSEPILSGIIGAGRGWIPPGDGC